MKAKVQLVELENKNLKTTEQFEINHAERLLRMPNNGGWQLPEDSAYKFDFNNGIGVRQDKKGNNGAKEKGDDQ